MKKYLLLLTIFMYGCKTVHYQRNEVLSRANEIRMLKDGVNSAINDDVDMLAPKSFSEVSALLDKSMSEAQKSEDPQAGIETAKKGLEMLASTKDLANESRSTLSDALNSRAKAQEAQADRLFESEFNELSEKLTKAAAAVESGDKKHGIEQNVELSRLFLELEVKALKASLASVAEKAYEDAVKAGAEKHAPITLKKAKEELDVSKRIVDIEKGNYDQARIRAEEARYLSKRAEYIANIVVGFRKEKLTDEEKILWYQDQLALAHKPLPTNIRFDIDNKDVVKGFSDELMRHREHVASLESQAVACEKKTANLTEKFEEGIKAKDKKIAKAEGREETFREVSSLFSTDEAEVLRRGDDVIIRLYGFYFPVGKAEVAAQNYSLLNKIAVAIVKYPNATVEVEGHTDNTGSKNANMRLSKERAENVAEFLVKVAGIEKDRVKSTGVGSLRPVFSNDSEENRAKNRRIEVVIENQ
jgi:OOP family OmpA-OmpF porin